MWDLLRSGIKPVSSALASRLFTTEPQGKPLWVYSFFFFKLYNNSFTRGYSWCFYTQVKFMENYSNQKKSKTRTFLAVQWLRLCNSSAGDLSSVPGWGTCWMLFSVAKRKKKDMIIELSRMKAEITLPHKRPKWSMWLLKEGSHRFQLWPHD